MGKIAGVFPIGDTGEEFVVAEWYPDPQVVANELFKLADDVEDWTEPLTEARAAFIYSTELHFESQSDPAGKSWEPLNSNYLNSKIKKESAHPEAILQLTGALREAAISQGAWFITEREIFFNAGELPAYGPIHQSGTIEGGKSLLHKGALDKLFGGRALTSEETAAVNTGGHGLNLPQRQFIGADEDTILEIEQIFVDWLSRTVVKDIGRGGPPIVNFGSNVLGTFPIIGRLGTGQPILSTPSGPRFGRKL